MNFYKKILILQVTACTISKGSPWGEKSMTIWKICQLHWWVLTLLLLLILISGWLSQIVRCCASVSTYSELNGWYSQVIPNKLHSIAFLLSCWCPDQSTYSHPKHILLERNSHYTFVNLFIYGCIGSSLLCKGFL